MVGNKSKKCLPSDACTTAKVYWGERIWVACVKEWWIFINRGWSLLPYLSPRFQRYLEVSSLEIENNRKGTRSEVGILCPRFDSIFRGSFITILMLDVLLLRVESADATKYMRYIRDILLETCKFLLI